MPRADSAEAVDSFSQLPATVGAGERRGA